MRKILTIVVFLGVPLLGLSERAFSQIPQVNPGGVVNSASWGGIVSPGSLVSVFGTNLASSAQGATGTPLPQTLGGTSVFVNGVPAPLLYVSPGQINLQLPSSIAARSAAEQPEITGGSLVVTTPAGSSAPAQFAVTARDPALFTVDSSGCGQASAQNISPDSNVSVNSHENSAAPGDFIALYGTGLGLAGRQPPDGVAASGAAALQIEPGVLVNGDLLPSLLYAGAAPGLVGMDQIDFQIPSDTPDGCSVPLGVSAGLGSPTVTISVHAGRGPCVDPPITSWGQIQISKTIFSDPGTPAITELDGVTLQFPSGPNVQPPAPSQIVFAPSYIANVPYPEPTFIGVFTSSANAFPECAVPGYAHLSAGILQLQTPTAGAFNIQPLPLVDGVTYSLSLPTGSVVRGSYTIAGTSGSAVDLQTSVSVGSPIQLLSVFPPGTAIPEDKPLTINWTGGDPGTLVKLTLISGGAEDYTYADAAAGTLTIPPICEGNPVSAGGNGVSCTFGVPTSSSAQIQISVSPSPDNITAVSAPGITGPVQIGWSYSWTFSGLSLTSQ